MTTSSEKFPIIDQTLWICEHIPLRSSGPQGYFGGCGPFVEIDDDLEVSIVGQTTLNDSLTEFAEELMQLDSSTNTPCPDNSSNAR